MVPADATRAPELSLDRRAELSVYQSRVSEENEVEPTNQSMQAFESARGSTFSRKRIRWRTRLPWLMSAVLAIVVLSLTIRALCKKVLGRTKIAGAQQRRLSDTSEGGDHAEDALDSILKECIEWEEDWSNLFESTETSSWESAAKRARTELSLEEAAGVHGLGLQSFRNGVDSSLTVEDERHSVEPCQWSTSQSETNGFLQTFGHTESSPPRSHEDVFAEGARIESFIREDLGILGQGVQSFTNGLATTFTGGDDKHSLEARQWSTSQSWTRGFHAVETLGHTESSPPMSSKDAVISPPSGALEPESWLDAIPDIQEALGEFQGQSGGAEQGQIHENQDPVSSALFVLPTLLDRPGESFLNNGYRLPHFGEPAEGNLPSSVDASWAGGDIGGAAETATGPNDSQYSVEVEASAASSDGDISSNGGWDPHEHPFLYARPSLGAPEVESLFCALESLVYSERLKVRPDAKKKSPSHVADRLAAFFMVFDAVVCAIELFGEHMNLPLWWEEFVDIHDTDADFGSPSARMQSIFPSLKAHIDLATTLSEALAIYKTGVRPDKRTIIALKRMIFFDKLASKRFRGARGDPWREDDIQYQVTHGRFVNED
ncbi:hypothetical protein Efla_006710 [Eimeria flavescens]